MANDGKMKLKAMLPTHFASEIHSGNLQNLGLVRILDYTCNTIPNQSEKYGYFFDSICFGRLCLHFLRDSCSHDVLLGTGL